MLLHSSRSENEFNRNFFETLSSSQRLPGFEWNLFHFSAEIFQVAVNGAIYVSKGTFWGKSIFFQNGKQTFLSELGQKVLSFSYQKVPWTTIKKSLFSCRLTPSNKWFSRETFHFRCFFLFLVGKLRQDCQNTSLRWQKNNWGNWLFTSNDLILDIVISDWTNFFGFWLKFLNRNVNTAFSGSRWTTSAKISFIGINCQFQFVLGF